MFITKFSCRLFGVRGTLYRLHDAAGEVLSVHATLPEAEAEKAARSA